MVVVEINPQKALPSKPSFLASRWNLRDGAISQPKRPKSSATWAEKSDQKNTSQIGKTQGPSMRRWYI